MTQNRDRTAASLPRRIEPVTTARQFAADPGDFNLYYSSAVAGDLAALLGAPHYSYRFAETKFLTAFAAQRATVHPLSMPEYYNTPAALPVELHADGKTDVHIIFRSAEQIRLLKFAWNVCCFAWEFDVIKDHTGIDEHPFLNQKRMLSLCQEVWVPCTYTKSVLESHGLRRVEVIPAPIPAALDDPPPLLEALSCLGHVSVAPLHYNFLRSKAENRAACAERASTFLEYVGARLKSSDELRIYLTILNPEDFRKNLDAMLRAFDLFSRNRRDAVLVVKVLTAASRFHLLDVLCDVIPNKMASGTVLSSDNIVFFNDFLSDREMGYLYSIADYYLCTSLGEGQNLPLLEAMASGVVPVSTANTAMADYINAENAVVIPGRLEPNDCVHLAGTLAGRPFSVHRSRVEDIHDALERSFALAPARYAALAAAARRVTRERYAPEVVWAAIASRLAAVRSLNAGKIPARNAPWH